ncbi:glycosyltransferase family 2 protein [Candidatus Latescibacterota bacterium]
MYREKKVCVVIPTYNEEKLITITIETIPRFVDKIIVVDDASKDRTVEIVKEISEKNPKVQLIELEVNDGVGTAVRTGYIWCRENNMDIAVVMNGDNQMDPKDLPALLNPLVEDRADYTKGNRLVTGEAWQIIPRIRYLGNSVLTFMTKIASGYWHVTDSQSGYTAMNKKCLHTLPLEYIYHGYGMPNDILVRCNIYDMRVMDVPIRPVYNVGEESNIKIHRVIFSISILILRLFFRRMTQKYIIRDFHPLVLFHMMGFSLMAVNIPLIIRLFLKWYYFDYIPSINALAILFCSFAGMQLILFALLFDMEANKELKGK